MRGLPALGIAAAASAFAVPASADPPARAQVAKVEPATADDTETDAPHPDAVPAWQTAPRERRSGFMAGVALGLGMMQASGYPNDVKKIGRERFYTETDPALGSSLTLWIGIAMADWLTFSVGGTGGGFDSGGLSAGGGALVFRTDVFPLWSLGGPWRELGVAAETGVGIFGVTPKDDTDKLLVDSGGASRVGLFAFYEGIRGWRFSNGPFLGGDYMWSSTMRRGEILLGWRTVLYTGP